MDHKTYQPKMPDIMEAVFDAVYLLFDLVAGIVFFAMAQGRPLFVLYGILTLTLCGGDAFHLVPRIFRAFRGSTPKIKHLMGTGLQISSITMTAFYVILLFIWKLTFPGFAAPAAVEVMIWASAIIRIAVCLLPQNNWCTDEGNLKLSILREAQGGPADDSQDLRVYVDHRYGPAAFGFLERLIQSRSKNFRVQCTRKFFIIPIPLSGDRPLPQRRSPPHGIPGPPAPPHRRWYCRRDCTRRKIFYYPLPAKAADDSKPRTIASPHVAKQVFLPAEQVFRTL